MAETASRHVLTEALWPAEGAGSGSSASLLVVLGIAALAICAKIKVPVWPSPVAISLGTFAVLTIGAAYGPRLGLATMAGWMLVGALGFNVFQSSSAESYGLAYMMGPTGGYLVGYLLATARPRLRRPPRLGPQRRRHGAGAPRRQRAHLHARPRSGSAT